MKKFFKKIALWTLLLMILSFGFGLAMSALYETSNIFKPTVLYNFAQKPTHIILGSSRALTTLNTAYIQAHRKEFGEIWYNLSMDDSSPEMHLVLIKMLIEQGRNPKQIYLQYDRTGSPTNIYDWQDNDYRFVPMLNRSGAIDEYFKHKKNYLYIKYFPLGTYSYFNTELIYPALMLLKNRSYRHRFDAFGDVTYPNNKTYVWNGERMNIKVNYEDSTLLSIRQVCLENNINLTLFIAPYLNKEVINAGQDVLNYSSIFIDNTLFYDAQHINEKGKQILTEQFLEQL